MALIHAGAAQRMKITISAPVGRKARRVTAAAAHPPIRSDLARPVPMMASGQRTPAACRRPRPAAGPSRRRPRWSGETAGSERSAARNNSVPRRCAGTAPPGRRSPERSAAAVPPVPGKSAGERADSAASSPNRKPSARAPRSPPTPGCRTRLTRRPPPRPQTDQPPSPR